MRVSIVTGLFVLFGVGALAVDETPLTEVSLQFQMLRLNSSIPSFTATAAPQASKVNFIDHLAAVAELGAEHNGNLHDIPLDNTWWTYLFGPLVSLTKRYSRIVPAFGCLLGGVNVAGSIKSPLLPDNARFRRTICSRACNRKLYLNGIETFSQNNFRYGPGIIFCFGSYAVI